MYQKPIPRNPHADNDLLDQLRQETPGHSGASGGRVAADVGSRDEARMAIGSDPQPTRATKGDKVQPKIQTRADHQAAQTTRRDAG